MNADIEIERVGLEEVIRREVKVVAVRGTMKTMMYVNVPCAAHDDSWIFTAMVGEGKRGGHLRVAGGGVFLGGYISSGNPCVCKIAF